MKKPTGLYAATLFVMIASLFAFAGPVAAQDVTLAWNPSESPNVAGYKIYYKAGDTQLPYDGIEALQGPSPIDVGNVTSVTLTEFPEGQVYYFWATAYDSEGNESGYSNMVASEWIPAPISPEQDDSTTTPATLVWTAAPNGRNMTYTISYGTSKNLKPKKTLAVPVSGGRFFGGPAMPGPAPVAALLVVLMATALSRLSGPRRRRRLLTGALCLGLTLATASCGGGGGGSGDSSSPSVSLSQDDDTVVVAGLTDNYYVTEELQSGVTYYWQVTAVDQDGQEHQSVISSFIAQ